MTKIRIPTLLATLAFLLGACGAGGGAVATVAPSTSPSPHEVIKIGFPASLSGPNALSGEEAVQGAKLAIQQINQAGGLLGKYDLSLVTEDGKCTPADGLNAANKLILAEKVNFLFDGICSGATLAFMPVAAANQIPLIIADSSNPLITDQMGIGGNKWAFRTRVSDAQISATFAKLVYDSLKIKSVYIYAEDDSFGRAGADTWVNYTKNYASSGAAVAGSAYYQPGAADHTAALTTIKAAKPDAIYFIGAQIDGQNVVRQFHQLGLTQRILCLCDLLSPSFVQNVGSQLAAGIIGGTYWSSSIDTALNKAFISDFTKAYGKAPSANNALPYWAVQVLANAIQIAGSVDGAKVVDAMRQVDLPVLAGKVHFDDHNQAHTDVYIVEIQADGTFKTIASTSGV